MKNKSKKAKTHVKINMGRRGDDQKAGCSPDVTVP
jgi:hypothetical protein